MSEFEVTEDDMKLRIDKFWHKVFSRTAASRENLVIITKMVKYAFAPWNSKADLERPFSANKRMLRKQSMSLREETIIWLHQSQQLFG